MTDPPPPGMTPENWRQRPWSVWAFRNAAVFLPTAPVAAPGPALQLPRARADDDPAWRAFLDATFATAAIAVRRGLVTHEDYAPGMGPHRPHMLFSITKSVLGLAAERMIAAGAIREGDRAGDVVAELGASVWARATLRSLLDMTDGVAFEEDYATPDAAIHRYSAAYWGTQPGGVRPALAAMEGVPRAGGGFSYRTPVADVVGWMVERAGGAPLSDLLSAHVWGPIGAEHPALHVLDTGGAAIGGTGLNATLPDMARLGLALLPGGMLAELGAKIAAGGDRAAFARSPQAETRPGWSYRSFWWVRHDPPALAALGVYGQRLWVDAATGLVVARFGAQSAAANAPHDIAHWTAFARLAAS